MKYKTRYPLNTDAPDFTVYIEEGSPDNCVQLTFRTNGGQFLTMLPHDVAASMASEILAAIENSERVEVGV